MSAEHRSPRVAVDLIIEMPTGEIVLIERKNPPHGWALPGGFVDYGESLEAAALREAREETGLEVTLRGQFHTYSDPTRDPRGHCISTVFVGHATGEPRAADDALRVALFPPDDLPPSLCFDHGLILSDYVTGRYPVPGR